MKGLEQFSLKGKVAIVTGSSRGIGRVIAEGLAAVGAAVTVSGRQRELVENVADGIAEQGGQSLAVQADVSQASDVDRLVEATVERFGRLDILVNNAGISPIYKRAERVTEAEWNQILAVNLTGVFLCCQAAAKVMMPQKSGRIINISSIGARFALPRLVAYCAAKGGIEAMMKVLAIEWARHNILINSIAPTYVETDMTQGLRDHPQIGEELLRQAPFGRLAKPEELVGAVIYLASDASSYVSGQTITIDGAWTAI